MEICNYLHNYVNNRLNFQSREYLVRYTCTLRFTVFYFTYNFSFNNVNNFLTWNSILSESLVPTAFLSPCWSKSTVSACYSFSRSRSWIVRVALPPETISSWRSSSRACRAHPPWGIPETPRSPNHSSRDASESRRIPSDGSLPSCDFSLSSPGPMLLLAAFKIDIQIIKKKKIAIFIKHA